MKRMEEKKLSTTLLYWALKKIFESHRESIEETVRLESARKQRKH